MVSPTPFGNERLEYVENRYRTGSETGNGSGQVWGHVGLRSSQGKLCAGKPFWIYRTTQSMARYSRHAAIRHAPKYWWIPTILDYSWNFNIPPPLFSPTKRVPFKNSATISPYTRPYLRRTQQKRNILTDSRYVLPGTLHSRDFLSFENRPFPAFIDGSLHHVGLPDSLPR